MLNKFRQMIRQAFYSVVSSDTSEYPQAQVTSNGKATMITRLSTYGVFANPPKDAHVVMFQSQGQESTKFGIFNDMIRRKKGLKEGECGLYNTLTDAIVYLKEDGTIEIESNVAVSVKAPIVDIEATTINLKGAVIVDGSLVIGSVNVGTHVHGGVTTGSGNTGGPV